MANIEKEIKNIPIKYYYPLTGPPLSETRKCIESLEEFKTLYNPEQTPDHAFNDYLIQEKGIGGIPGSCFYYNQDRNIYDWKGQSYVRFSVCKNNDSIAKLESILGITHNTA